MLEAEFRLDPVPCARPDAAPPPAEAQREAYLARAQMYRLLGAVFAEEASPDFIDALRSAAALAEMAHVGVAFDADFLHADAQDLTEALACEYTALFVASGGFPPIESVRLSGRYKQEPHFQVLACYRQSGFELGRARFDVLPDQLGVELMYVAELLERSAAAATVSDLPRCHALERDIKRFWSLHLGRWVRGYCGLIAKSAQHSFYREMALLLGGFAEEEIELLGLKRLEDADEGRAVVPKREVRVEFDPDEPVCGACPAGRASQAVAAPQPLHDLRP